MNQTSLFNRPQIQLRDYQNEALAALYTYFRLNDEGDPLIVAPTGSGKSIMIAKFATDACQRWDDQRIIVTAHRKELLVQNHEKMEALWPCGSIGLYSAGLKKRQSYRRIVVGGIQSLFRKGPDMGHVNLLIVDEAHLIPPSGQGMYRQLIESLRLQNPRMRIIGFTATPFRMKQGILTDGEGAIFNDIAYNISIRRLINDGYLSPLISKSSVVQADLSDVRTRGGEFVAGDAEHAMDNLSLTRRAVEEIERYSQGRRSWLVFAAGVNHARTIAQVLRERGHNSASVIGEDADLFRQNTIDRFKSGALQCLVNCDLYTTGFDAPNVDMIVLLRPTKSTGLYVQMLGRGMRTCPGKQDCLVLDFAGNLERHGPIDAIEIRSRTRREAASVNVAPNKTCPECREVIHARLMECPQCGYVWEGRAANHDATASSAPVMSGQQRVTQVRVLMMDYTRHVKRFDDGPPSMRVWYRCLEETQTRQGDTQLNYEVSEWVCFEHEGYARHKACQWWATHVKAEHLQKPVPMDVTEALNRVDELKGVSLITVDRSGKFDRVTLKTFRTEEEEAEAERLQELADRIGI